MLESHDYHLEDYLVENEVNTETVEAPKKASRVEPSVSKSVSLPRTHYSYPFSKMEKGDSFFISLEEMSDVDMLKRVQAVRNAAYTFWMRYGKKFTVRQIRNTEGEKGVRVWRII